MTVNNSIFPNFNFPSGEIRNESSENIASQQLKRKPTTEVNLKSGKLGLNDGTYVDLNRYGKLIINDEKKPVYDIKSTIPVPSKEAVLEKILEATGNELAVVVKLADLLQQDTEKLAHYSVFQKYNLEYTHDFRQKGGFGQKEGEKVSSIKLDKENFRVEKESLGRIVDRSDPEEENSSESVRYVKFKTVITGKRIDLTSGNMDNIDTKYMHTAAFKTEKAARTANYKTGLFDFSPDAKSYIH